MTNKEIFDIAQRLTRSLKQLGVIDNIPRNKQPIYEALKPLLEEQERKERIEPATLPTDEELRAQLRLHLVDKLSSGQLQAAEIAQLKDVFGLTAHKEDINITVETFKDIPVECPSCGVNIHEPAIDLC